MTKTTPVENYEFNKKLQIFDTDTDVGHIAIRKYTGYDIAVSMSARDADGDYTVMEYTAEQARAIGTMLLYAAQEADNAKEDTA